MAEQPQEKEGGVLAARIRVYEYPDGEIDIKVEARDDPDDWPAAVAEATANIWKGLIDNIKAEAESKTDLKKAVSEAVSE